ncbi:hypothetical protein AMTRI_Chr01g114770 [Amborella trichopoda]|uniref:transcription factor bHLH66 n=1 Tax=Amborella trichopoda TaxID=13333 RepID=UPI0005D369B4|nr:transcription factor bHLH66 [Amborella trichopoda]XP_020527119.1 transcription factor bHLH66 [Amborella trichopoda]XP_020527120.1 transcription factor bHLH66 [Amborella trichopoda]XP_020527121.1 transcription factor bHLH66 [Amborella trichopoda]XP_020527122.1 transcription factor bHLH66 [Amborella trichopoda]XP_020527124.1 transcription factor bHLH66 [Amborella trichopoda]|eukprot:XP_011625690.1 transcription factor bHLH66 [Amborella trichopoda]
MKLNGIGFDGHEISEQNCPLRSIKFPFDRNEASSGLVIPSKFGNVNLVCSNSRPLHAIPIVENCLPGSSLEAGKRALGFQPDSSYINSRIPSDCMSKRIRNSAASIPVLALNSEISFTQLLNGDKSDAEMNLLGPFPELNIMTEQDSHASIIQVVKREMDLVCKDQPDANDIPAAIALRPPSIRALRGQATNPHSISERLRRDRIVARMNDLHGLLPNCQKGDQASILDDIIDYVKYLQLQIKVLSKHKLCGKEPVHPLIHIEGFGHYELYNASYEPLEEKIAKLMESDTALTVQLLMSKGLSFMPMTFEDSYTPE